MLHSTLSGQNTSHLSETCHHKAKFFQHKQCGRGARPVINRSYVSQWGIKAKFALAPFMFFFKDMNHMLPNYVDIETFICVDSCVFQSCILTCLSFVSSHRSSRLSSCPKSTRTNTNPSLTRWWEWSSTASQRTTPARRHTTSRTMVTETKHTQMWPFQKWLFIKFQVSYIRYFVVVVVVERWFHPCRVQPDVEREIQVRRPCSRAGHGAVCGGGLWLNIPEWSHRAVLSTTHQHTEW